LTPSQFQDVESTKQNLDKVITAILELLTKVDVLLVQDWYFRGHGSLRCDVAGFIEQAPRYVLKSVGLKMCFVEHAS